MSSARPFIVLFDGVCNLCNSSVQFILKRDKKKKFLFGSSQGEAGQKLLQQFSLPTDNFHSFVLIEGDKVYTQSTAALRMAKHLKGGWQLFYGFIILPKFLRDGMYKWIATNRYKWFGKRDTCRIPTAAERSRFLD